MKIFMSRFSYPPVREKKELGEVADIPLTDIPLTDIPLTVSLSICRP